MVVFICTFRSKFGIFDSTPVIFLRARVTAECSVKKDSKLQAIQIAHRSMYRCRLSAGHSSSSLPYTIALAKQLTPAKLLQRKAQPRNWM